MAPLRDQIAELNSAFQSNSTRKQQEFEQARAQRVSNHQLAINAAKAAGIQEEAERSRAQATINLDQLKDFLQPLVEDINAVKQFATQIPNILRDANEQINNRVSQGVESIHQETIQSTETVNQNVRGHLEALNLAHTTILDNIITQDPSRRLAIQACGTVQR